MEHLASNIKQMREKNGFSQEKLASLVGVTRAQISAIETGTRVPSLGLVNKIALVFNTPIYYLFLDPMSTSS